MKQRSEPRARQSLVGLLAVIALWLLPQPSTARALEPDYQQWLQVQLDLKLPHKLLTNLDVQARRMNAPLNAVKDASGEVVSYASNPNSMLLVRPSVGYQLLPWLSGWAGYGATPVFFDDPRVRGAKNIDEHRLFEQLSSSFKLADFVLSTRTRLEQRVRGNGPGSAENDADLPRWAHRLRQLARAQFTLVGGTPWLGIVWDEVFVHLNETNYPSKAGLDQNRLFVGAGYQASPELRVELGYLNQYVRRFSDPHQLNHVLSASLNFKLDASEIAKD